MLQYIAILCLIKKGKKTQTWKYNLLCDVSIIWVGVLIHNYEKKIANIAMHGAILYNALFNLKKMLKIEIRLRKSCDNIAIRIAILYII